MEQDRQIEDIVNQLYQGPVAYKIQNKDSVRIKYAESYFQEITVSVSREDQVQQSLVIDKSSVRYQARQLSDNDGQYVKNQNVDENRRMSDPVSVVVKELGRNSLSNIQSFMVPIMQVKNNVGLIHINNDDKLVIDLLQNKEQEKLNNIEQQNDELSDVDTKMVQKYESIKSQNCHQISKIYYLPVQIVLPQILQVNNLVEIVTPYIFNEQVVDVIEQKKNDKKVEQKFEQFSCKDIDNDKDYKMGFFEGQIMNDRMKDNKIVNDVLLMKINELLIKVKQLQNQKRLKQGMINDGKFRQEKIGDGVCDYNKILFSTSSSAQTKLGDRIREQKQKCKINSNVFSLKIHNNNNNSIFDEINFLKKKVEFLEKKNQKNRGECGHGDGYERKELKGKIVRRRGSNGTPVDLTENENDFEGINQQSMYKKQQIFENQKDDEYEYKKMDVRKVVGSAIQRSRGFMKQNQNEFHTLQFNLSKQKLVVQESRQFNFKNQENYYTQENVNDDIQIPQLEYFPVAQSSLQDLVEIGKIALEKFGCPVDSDTPFYVKKYKNCVHYKLNNFNVLWHFDGKMYLGGWNPLSNGQGQKTGEGIQFIPGKYKFKGTFVEGKRCGFGKIVFQNGTIYVGQWLNGLKHGKGKLRQSNGLQYQGQWRNGKKNGQGIIRLKQRKEFEGIFKNNLKNGYGKQYFENGDYYEGFYQNNKFHGKGKYLWKSMANYNGEFKQGKRHGYGIWRSLDKNYDQYEGNYYEDNKNGQGIYRWSNGAVYNGGFKNDQKHGQGTIMYPNGKVEKLNWVNGAAQKKNSLSHRSNQNRQKSMSNSKTKFIVNSKTERKNFISKQLPNKMTRTNSANINPNFQRAIPKGVSFKRFKQSDIDNQLRNKLKATDYVEFEHRNKNFNDRKDFQNEVKDPPYKSMKTSSIINFNNI